MATQSVLLETADVIWSFSLLYLLLNVAFNCSVFFSSSIHPCSIHNIRRIFIIFVLDHFNLVVSLTPLIRMICQTSHISLNGPLMTTIEITRPQRMAASNLLDALFIDNNMGGWMASTPRDQYRYAPSQRETALHCNDVSYWLGAPLDWSLTPIV